ncbi:MAG: hypothetical protein Q7K42_02300 [Candidatus Diapherotrites archaeon]|nr:hypothetical protein [Candidatus Diapherotrites archaeon]
MAPNRRRIPPRIQRKGTPKPIQKKSFVVPIKPLPVEVVERIRRIIAKRREEFLGKMKIGDHRSRDYKKKGNKYFEAIRVRLAEVIRDFHSSIVLKYEEDAQITVNMLRKFVEKHNEQFGSKDYYLQTIPVAVVHENVIAMPFVDAPSVEEIIGDHFGECKTQRGNNFFKQLQRTTGITKNDISIAFEKLGAKDEVMQNLGIHNSDSQDQIILLGAKNGKPVFALLTDLE